MNEKVCKRVVFINELSNINRLEFFKVDFYLSWSRFFFRKKFKKNYLPKNKFN